MFSYSLRSIYIKCSLTHILYKNIKIRACMHTFFVLFLMHNLCFNVLVYYDNSYSSKEYNN